MSSNKGKDGEMRVAILLSNISIAEEGCDFTRPTNTNTADGGADLVFEHPDGFTDSLVNIGNDSQKVTDIKISEKIVKIRIDVKTTDKKLSLDTVIKFGGDIRKNPDCQGHMLVGGKSLTRGAQKKFEEIKNAVSEEGKNVNYIPNNGLNKIENHYNSLPKPVNLHDNNETN